MPVSKVMQYKNGEWGTEYYIHLIFAHEIYHIFGAKDEYEGHDDKPSGTLQIPNGNAKRCGAGKCLIHGGILCKLVMCKYTRGQVGWYWNSKEYVNEKFSFEKNIITLSSRLSYLSSLL